MHRFANSDEQAAFRAATAAVASKFAVVADAPRTWHDLKQGRACLLDSFTIDNSAYLVVTRECEHGPAPELAVEMLERVLLGTYPKHVALDYGVATSTLVGVLRLALRGMGVTCSPSKVPFGLVALVRAARAEDGRPLIYEAEIQLDGHQCQILTTRFSSLDKRLPPAVGAVLRLLAEGKSHREMASLRGTSERTIANQLATAFARIGDSGRNSAIKFLLGFGANDSEQGLDVATAS